MSSRKVLAQRSANKQNSGTPGTRSTPKNSSNVSRNLSSNSSSNLTITSAPSINPLNSQKYMQHKLDMSYNKYIQTLALNQFLTKIHKEMEDSLDVQLTYYENIHQVASEEQKSKKEFLSNMKIAADMEANLQCLEKSLENITKLIEDENIVKKLDKFNRNLHLICDKLSFNSIKFINNEENYCNLQIILEDISTVLKEINEDNSEDFLLLVENMVQIKDSFVDLRKLHETVKNYQFKTNNLVLKTASMKLSSKPDENTKEK